MYTDTKIPYHMTLILPQFLFPVAMTKYLNQSNAGRKGLFQLKVRGSGPT